VEDDGRKQGGKRTAARAPEFQKVNNFRFNFRHVTIALHSNLSQIKNQKNLIIMNIQNNYNTMKLVANWVTKQANSEVIQLKKPENQLWRLSLQGGARAEKTETKPLGLSFGCAVSNSGKRG
jgi:hypothetical protein